jgi:hypothetical protein
MKHDHKRIQSPLYNKTRIEQIRILNAVRTHLNRVNLPMMLSELKREVELAEERLAKVSEYL